jgi:hypothetical protein
MGDAKKVIGWNEFSENVRHGDQSVDGGIASYWEGSTAEFNVSSIKISIL